MFKAYRVILEDSENAYKIMIPAENEESAAGYVEGNGDVINIKDVTDDIPISLTKIVDALTIARFGKTEIDIIIRIMRKYENAID